MLRYPFKVRDILHRFVYLTERERKLIDKPVFQRLRFIAQNDVASRVYPSLNTSRFEHSLGTAFVAGKIAENILLNFDRNGDDTLKKEYLEECGFRNEDDFTETVRIYGLIHDIGHLPLSHLFEMAFEDYAAAEGVDIEDACEKWFRVPGFRFLHEACAADIIDYVLRGTGLNRRVKSNVVKLVTEKELDPGDVLFPIKQILDSEVDGDRIDATARDGLQAGGEYGNYDIERICTSFNIIKTSGYWDLGYSHKAENCLESLLFERYRTFTWIHFHHRVIVIKTAGRVIINALIAANKITPGHFRRGELKNRDDFWLWRLIRSYKPKNDAEKAAKKLLVQRDKKLSFVLWKHREYYHRIQDTLLEEAHLRNVEPERANIGNKLMDRAYEAGLSQAIGATPGTFEAKVSTIKFKPIGKFPVNIIGDNGEVIGDLIDKSPITGFLTEIWKAEPQYYVVFFGTLPNGVTEESLEGLWRGYTAPYLRSKVS
ncbi:MAG: HD domain-containing protein [bacterium]